VDVEARLLLYTVALGAATGLGHLVWRRAFEFRAYMSQLAVLLAASVAALLVPEWTRAAAWPSFFGFLTVAVLPSALLETARRAAATRRYGAAWATSTAGAAVIGMPAPLFCESAIYGALSAAERGDEATCRRRLERVARRAGIPEDLGGDALVRVLPAAARRRWEDVLAALDGCARRPPPLLVVEARAAAETGDLRRAIRAVRAIDALGGASPAARASARRALFSAAGRAEVLADAAARRAPLVDGPAGTAELAVARAKEARGDAAGAAAGYDAALRVGRGAVLIDAEAGARRCREGRLLVVAVEEADAAAILEIETASRDDALAAPRRPLARRAPFTVGVAAATAAASALVFFLIGRDTIAFVAAGALSAPLIAEEGEWWRLGATMLLHGGWFHLAMNVATIVFIGAPLESRVGPARTAVVYVGSGLVASLASAFGNDTPVGVGASGAAMGLIGALGVLLLARPRLFADAERRRWLGMLGVTVAATLAIGLAESEAIDNVAHGAGAVAGAVIGFLLLRLETPSPAHVWTRRLVAAALAAWMVACVVATAARLPDWTGEQVVETAGARATLPSWMRVRSTPEDGVLASRTPLDLVVQFGAAPARPRPDLLVPAHEPSRRDFTRLLAAGPTRRGGVPAVEGASVACVDYAETSGKGFRLYEFHRGAAFAVAVVWMAEGGESEDEALAVRIGRSLESLE
jgi:membrane associated rhomboid family serine protease